jgi:hypothetical protein
LPGRSGYKRKALGDGKNAIWAEKRAHFKRKNGATLLAQLTILPIIFKGGMKERMLDGVARLLDLILS